MERLPYGRYAKEFWQEAVFLSFFLSSLSLDRCVIKSGIL